VKLVHHARAICYSSAVLTAVEQLAHDMRSVVSTILMWEQVARLAGPERHDEALEAIRTCALAQVKLIDDLVALGSTDP
jgi:hypothetical protein